MEVEAPKVAYSGLNIRYICMNSRTQWIIFISGIQVLVFLFALHTLLKVLA